MDIVKFFKDSPILTSTTSIQELCKPLKDYGIDFFLYAKTFSDGKHIFLSTDALWNETYITNLYNLRYIQQHLFGESLQSYHLLSTDMFPENIALQDIEKHFNIHYGLALPFTDGKNKEICYFGTKHQNQSIFNTFINNLDRLKTFKIYFKDLASKIIQEAERRKLPAIENHKKSLDIRFAALPTPSRKIQLEPLDRYTSRRYYLVNDPQERYLTKAEYNCVCWVIRGKSAEEIGYILGTSKRTVESYITNLKNKFQCLKSTQLICLLIQLGLDVIY